MRVREGGIEFEVPDQSGDRIEEGVFFNPDQELNRDLTVAVLRTLREARDAESYLDATTASGVRGARAAANGWDATLCDRDSEAVELARRTLERNGLSGEVVHRDANALMHERHFDVVDLDPFGTPIPFADAAFRSAREVVCATATDTAPLCGAHLQSGIRSYGAVPRNTEYHAEMGLRVLVSALARTAARYDVGVTPVVTHATAHYARTYLSLEGGATVANEAIDELGYVHHCPECRWRTSAEGLIADPPEACPNCGSDHVVSAGPVWLGDLQDRTFLADVRDAVDDGMGTADAARDLLSTLAGELSTPTHYDQHRLCKVWGRPATAMDEFLDRLREAGFEATRTHHGGTTFKTDADVDEIRRTTAE